MTCPFCQLPPERIVFANPNGMVIRDGFPVSPGHTLIIPRRHVGSFFVVTDEERADVKQLLAQSRHDLDREFRPAGYNIGTNDGAAQPALAEALPRKREAERPQVATSTSQIVAPFSSPWSPTLSPIPDRASHAALRSPTWLSRTNSAGVPPRR